VWEKELKDMNKLKTKLINFNKKWGKYGRIQEKTFGLFGWNYKFFF
jgi:hypothetical protein